MERTLLDTSIYGELIKELDVVDKLVSCIPQQMVIYGSRVIRNELRETPKAEKEEGKNKRSLLLKTYDLLVRKENHSLPTNKLVESLAADYLGEYKKQRGALSHSEMANDLIIVATATIYHLDIVVSNDKRSLLSSSAAKAYKLVNLAYRLNNPVLMDYQSFKERVTRIFQYGKQYTCQ